MTRVASRHRTAEVTSRHERKSSSSEGRLVKMRQHSSWVVEFSLEIHASVSIHMHIGNAMLHNSSSCTLSLPEPYCSFVLFPPTPLIVFLVAMKKCAMPLSEPLVDQRPRSEMVRRSWCIGGPREYCHKGAQEMQLWQFIKQFIVVICVAEMPKNLIVKIS